MHSFPIWNEPSADFPPCIMIFNEDEFHSFACKFEPGIPPIMKSGALPHLPSFARAASAIRRRFGRSGRFPRIYVTLGGRGSLGVTEDGLVAYVASFSKPRAEIFDTNACGDAYCATISMLEWSKRNGYADVSGADLGEVGGAQREMLYFMAVASAAAYCKATNRRGQLYARELVALLAELHVASAPLPSVEQLVDGPYPKWIVEKSGWVGSPPDSRIMAVSPDLRKVLGQ